jgi:hypothetical protein
MKGKKGKILPSPEGCCHNCARDGKYLLEVRLNGYWWHFKCVETKADANLWLRWRSDDGSFTRMRENAKKITTCEKTKA